MVVGDILLPLLDQVAVIRPHYSLVGVVCTSRRDNVHTRCRDHPRGHRDHCISLFLQSEVGQVVQQVRKEVAEEALVEQQLRKEVAEEALLLRKGVV